MSLETQIAELNENIKNLIEVFGRSAGRVEESTPTESNGVNSVHTPTRKEPLQAKIEMVVNAKGISGAKAEVKKIIAAETKAEEPEQTPEEFYAKVLRPAAQALILAKGNTALADLLKAYGVATLPKLPTTQYARMLELVRQATEA